jgi:NAD(P)-dependent dehydrogenase (short-subunit alcohol dehydrogenase family)
MTQPAQHQDKQPGVESEMSPKPEADRPEYQGSGKLKNKVALITGGDSGIGKAVALCYAKEGADIFITYLDEHDDAKETQSLVKKLGQRCELLAGDISREDFCKTLVETVIQKLGRLDIVVNNAAVQFPQKTIEEIDSEQLLKIFSVNVFSFFYVTHFALAHLKPGSAIINTSSVTAYKGSAVSLDYASTKGAIVAFTRSLSQALMKKNIRVNAVAPGPIWTPLIPATLDAETVAEFGSQVPMQRIGQPAEVAPCYVFLASSDSSYMSGQVLHPNGGVIVNA